MSGLALVPAGGCVRKLQRPTDEVAMLRAPAAVAEQLRDTSVRVLWTPKNQRAHDASPLLSRLSTTVFAHLSHANHEARYTFRVQKCC